MLDAEIEKRLIRILRDADPGSSATDYRFELIASDDRDIYRISAPGGKNFIFKTTGSNRKSELEFVNEFRILERFHKRAEIKGFRINIPEVAGLIDDQGFLMTECRGETLKSLYFRSLFNLPGRTRVRHAIRQSASLLTQLHALDSRLEPYEDYRINRLENLSRMTTSILASTIAPGHREIITQSANAFAAVNEPVENIEICETHGNFALRNLLWDGSEASAIDFEDSRTDTIYFDIALPIAELLNKNIYPGSRAFNAGLIDGFLDSYQREKPLNHRVLASYILYHLIWSYYELSGRTIPRNPAAKIFLAYRKRLLMREIGMQLAACKPSSV